MAQSSSNHFETTALYRIAGYGLLLIAFFNLVDIFVPTYFTDPNWKINTVSTLIERMPVALVGAVLVFWGGEDYRQNWERLVLKVLSWSTLVVGVLFLMLVPLVVKAAMELDSQNTIQINAQYKQQVAQLEQVQAQINNATEQQTNTLIETLKNQNFSLNIEDTNDLKRQIATEVDQAKKAALTNSKSTQASQRLSLRKSVVKWGLSSLVSAFLFFFIWHMTRWARYDVARFKPPSGKSRAYPR